MSILHAEPGWYLITMLFENEDYHEDWTVFTDEDVDNFTSIEKVVMWKEVDDEVWPVVNVGDRLATRTGGDFQTRLLHTEEDWEAKANATAWLRYRVGLAAQLAKRQAA